MEEARLDFFKNLGFDYLEFEKMGLASPVIGLNNIKYKKPTTVGDLVDVDVKIKSYNSVTLVIHYTITKNGELVFEGDSEHCFLNEQGKLFILSEKNYADLHYKLKELADKFQ